MPRFLTALIVALALAGCRTAGGAVDDVASLTAAGWPVTTAEATGFEQATRYDDVMAFLEAIGGHGVHVTTFGTSVEGRALPLAVWGAPDASAEAVRQTGKTRVLVFANIHAGEVCGKEAALMLLRDLARGQHAAWADSVVLLVAPIYNADGNERIEYGNRPLQLGPVGGMGQRPNAQGLDLNRDFTKLAAPESRALARVFSEYDPHVVMDLHTTDGTPMGYGLTYAPPLSPNTDPALDRLLRDRWLPAASAAILASDGEATWHYGNVPGAFGEAAAAPRGWYSFSGQPRFGTTLVGLRNRLGILSEAYSYATFEDRVKVTKRFVEEVVENAYRDASRVRALTAAADARSVVGKPLALRSTFAALPEPAEVLLGAVDTVAHPVTGAPMLRRRPVRRPETMPAYIRFAPTETERAPSRYVISFSPQQAALGELLAAHGVRVDTAFVWGVARERFVVDSVRVASRPYQNVRPQEVWGRWVPVPAETGPMPRLAPSLVVPMGQPLARVVFALLEPRSDDGVVAWGLLDVEGLSKDDTLPVQRVP